MEWPIHQILSKRFQNKSECETVERYLKGLKGRRITCRNLWGFIRKTFGKAMIVFVHLPRCQTSQKASLKVGLSALWVATQNADTFHLGVNPQSVRRSTFFCCLIRIERSTVTIIMCENLICYIIYRVLCIYKRIVVTCHSLFFFCK